MLAMEAPRSWVSKRPKIEGWAPPLADADIESELKRVSRASAGVELEKEAKLLEELFQLPLQSVGHHSSRKSPRGDICPTSLSRKNESAPRGDEKHSPSGFRSHATPGRSAAHALRSLLMHLPSLARVVDMLEGFANFAAISSRWFCACHLARIATLARRLKCLDRSLRFRSHLDFKAADIRVDDAVVDLEVAVDLLELESSQLRTLMGVKSESNTKSPPLAAKVSAFALHELLIVGRPELTDIGCNTGIWPQDRRILDPAILLPLLIRFHRGAISRDARKRLRSVFCAHLDELTPQAALSGASQEEPSASDSAADVKTWRAAAAAVLQWAWVQLAHEELECDRTSHLGIIEKSLLLQPNLGIRRIERYRKIVLEKLEILRSEPMLGRLLHAPLDSQLPSSQAGTSLRRSPRAPAPNMSAEKISQPRLAAGRQQRSLPALHGLHVGTAVASRAKIEPQLVGTPVRNEQKRYLIGDTLPAPSLSIATTPLANPSAKMLPHHMAFSSGNDCPRRGHTARKGVGRKALLAWPRSLRSDVTLREALGFPLKEEKDLPTSVCADDVSTAEPFSSLVSDSSRDVRCVPRWQNWRRPVSAPANLPWSSPGLRFCTPLRA